MQEDGLVSVWIGSAQCLDDWTRAIEVPVSEDGDFAESEFGQAFDLGYYDTDYQEAEFYPSGRSNIDLLLRGVSYDDQVIPAVEKLDHSVTDADNCFALLYNYRYDGGKTEWRGHGVRLRFVGTIRYDPAK